MRRPRALCWLAGEGEGRENLRGASTNHDPGIAKRAPQTQPRLTRHAVRATVGFHGQQSEEKGQMISHVLLKPEAAWPFPYPHIYRLYISSSSYPASTATAPAPRRACLQGCDGSTAALETADAVLATPTLPEMLPTPILPDATDAAAVAAEKKLWVYVEATVVVAPLHFSMPREIPYLLRW